MKREKKLKLLICTFFAICILGFSIKTINNEKLTAGEKEILQLTNITVIEWTYDDETYPFEKQEDMWIHQNDEGFIVAQDKLNDIEKALNSVVSTIQIEEVDNYNQYGLLNPQCTVKVTTDEKVYSIRLGEYSDIDEQRYCLLDDGNVYLLKEDLLEYFNLELNDFLQLESIPEVEQIESFTISGTHNFTVDYSENNTQHYSNQYQYFLENNAAIDTDDFEDYADELLLIEWQDCMSHNANEEELKDCGLNDPNMTIELQYDNQQTLTIHLSKKNDNYYARIKDSNFIYSISEEAYTNFSDTFKDDLRAKEIALLDWGIIPQMEVTLNGNSYVFVKDDDEYLFNNEEINFDNIITELEDITIEDFTETTPTKSKEISFTIHQDGPNFQKLQYDIYQNNGETCIVYLNDEYLGLCARSTVIDFIEAINTIVLQ